ncbi:MAG: hypothetical protein IKV17_01375 [Bacteroidaceae bacterium]|nr:hypothetical protein [Bacteroidaceae bacterium]
MQSKSVAIVVMLLFFVIPVSAQFNHKGDSLLRFTNRGIWDGKRGGAVTKKGDVSKKATPAKKAVIKKDAAKAVKSSVAKKRSVRNDSVVYTVRYSLGDRVIMRGDSGADVRKVAEILVRNLFIDEKDIPYTVTGEVLFDGELVRALKLFQKVEGLYEDGMVSEPTLKRLRKRSSRKR